MLLKELGIKLKLVGAVLGATLMIPSMLVSAVTYVAGHPDDMELFMGKDLMSDIAARVNLNLVIVTAGDAGNNLTANSSNSDWSNYAGNVYPSVRLGAHKAAIMYAMTISGGGDYISPSQINVTTENLAGKAITVTTINYPGSTNRIKLYNLMLPDGARYGGGFANDGYQSLTKLYTGKIAKINSLDPIKNTYTKDELINVVRSIVTTNEKTSNRFHVKFPQTDRSINTGSHDDHIYSGMLTEQAIAGLGCAVKYRFNDYVINTLPATILGAADREKLWGMFGALNSYLVQYGNRNTVNNVHSPWVGRQQYIYQNGACAS